jgi:flavin reductase (DIM6/NTAB) family NADH-FMN oxidoreductase RutF
VSNNGAGNAEATLSREEFISIMAAFPTGVTVVTTLDGTGQPKGLASSAFTSVSADPPLLLVCVDKSSRTLPALLDSRAFCVNFLKSGRHGVCGTFASKIEDKFADIPWRPAGNGMPALHEDAVAHAECVTEDVVEAGDHVILIGRVVGGRAPAEDETPLAYYRRAFGSFAPRLPGEASG